MPKYINDNKSEELTSRFYGKVEIDQAYSFLQFSKQGKVQKLLHQLKYGGKPELGEVIGNRLGNELKELQTDKFDVIIPVPLHKKKLRRRGYNQSEVFAKGLSQALGVPLKTDILYRVKMSHTQTHKSRVERWQNISDAFELTKPDSLADKHVLLVDDVITTGATLEACAKEIVAYANKVSIATIAIA